MPEPPRSRASRRVCVELCLLGAKSTVENRAGAKAVAQDTEFMNADAAIVDVRELEDCSEVHFCIQDMSYFIF